MISNNKKAISVKDQIKNSKQQKNIMKYQSLDVMNISLRPTTPVQNSSFNAFPICITLTQGRDYLHFLTKAQKQEWQQTYCRCLQTGVTEGN